MISNSGLTEHLKARCEERHEKYTVEKIDGWPNLLAIDAFTYLGMFSWTMPFRHKRLLQKSAVIDLGWGEETPTDIVRDYLDFKFPARLRATAAQKTAIREHRAFPCMAQRGAYQDMVYIDLKSAYWSITKIVGWNVDYFPNRWVGVQGDVSDFPLHYHKAARSSLVTAGLSSSIRVWDGKGLRWKTGENKHINYGLWALVQDTLHGIAATMLELGAVYVHTDGYIIPAAHEQTALAIIDDWGLFGAVKFRGAAEIFGIGSYTIGEHQTKRVGITPVQNWFAIEEHADRDWLKEKISFWSARSSS